MHRIHEDLCSFPFLRRLTEIPRKVVTIENVVPQHQGTATRAYEVPPYDESLRDSLRLFLHCIFETESETRAISQQLPESRSVFWSRDHQNVTDPRQHQCGKRVIRSEEHTSELQSR